MNNNNDNNHDNCKVFIAILMSDILSLNPLLMLITMYYINSLYSTMLKIPNHTFINSLTHNT